MANERELSSWKEIADYLRVSVRTAQGWEKDHGLPIRRVGTRGRVFANTDALDAWKTRFDTNVEAALAAPQLEDPAVPAPVTREVAISRPRSVRWFVLGCLTFGVFAAALWLLPNSRAPAVWRVSNNTLIVSDDSDKEVWRTTFPDELEHVAYDVEPGKPCLCCVRPSAIHHRWCSFAFPTTVRNSGASFLASLCAAHPSPSRISISFQRSVSPASPRGATIYLLLPDTTTSITRSKSACSTERVSWSRSTGIPGI